MSTVKRRNSFPFKWEDAAGKTYEGTFTARIATFADKTRISVRASQICGGMYCCRDDEGQPTGRGVDEDTDFKARTWAWLETVLEQAPVWFKLEDKDEGITDDDLVFSLFQEVQAFEKRFRPAKRRAAEGEVGQDQSSEGAGAAQSAPADGRGRPTPVVGAQVPASLDP